MQSIKMLVLASLSMAVMWSCGGGAEMEDSSSTDASNGEDSVMTVGYVTKSATNQGWVLINQGATDAAAEEGVAIFTLGPAHQGNLQGQLSAIEDMLARNVDALAIAPVDSAGVAPVVETAMNSGVPVVAIDTAVEGADVTSYVATDNLAAAESQAKWASEQLSDGDEIIYVTGNTAQSTGRERRDGFVNNLKEMLPGIQIYEVPTKWDQTEAQNGVEAQLAAHPNVKMIANAWDGGALGSIAALKAAGMEKGKVLVVGFDGAPNGLQAMRDGWLQADVAQMLYQQGFQGVQAAVRAARGEEVDARIDTGHFVVTPDNVEEFITDNGLGIFMQ